MLGVCGAAAGGAAQRPAVRVHDQPVGVGHDPRLEREQQAGAQPVAAAGTSGVGDVRGQRLGALLRQARGPRSILDTALAAGVSPETLRKIETGRVATPSFATVAAVARVVGVSLDQLWSDVADAEQAGSAAS